MKKALVLGGGGSKGAYELGVWKALNELHMTFDLVCGTSIGAMNGVLYAQKDYEKAYHLWMTIEVDDVFTHGVSFDMDLDLLLSQKEKYGDLMSSYIKHKGVNIQPFIDTITPLFDAEKFFQSDIDYACMTYNFTKGKAEAFSKKDMRADNVLDYVLASGSCFPAFPMKEIDHEYYIDGGYSDNVPVALAKKLGADVVVAVDLKPIEHKQLHEDEKNVLYIQPYVSLGSFLLFDRDRIKRNMQLGYQDTLKKLGQFYGTIYTFSKNDKHLIEQLNAYLQNSVDHMYEFLNDDELPLVIEKVRDFRNQQYLKPYEGYDYPYVAMIEDVAWMLELTDIGIWNFERFVKTVYTKLQERSLILSNIQLSVSGLKDFIIELKNKSELECICFIFQFIMDTSMDEREREKGLHALRLVFNDSFAKACCIYAYAVKMQQD